MKTFIQLRDGVGFAIVNTAGEDPDHSVTPDHTNAIEVTGLDNPETFIHKKYDQTTKKWSSAPLFKFADIDSSGYIIEVKRTYFEHQVTGPLLEENTEMTSRWIDGRWDTPVFISPVEQPAISAPIEYPTYND